MSTVFTPGPWTPTGSSSYWHGVGADRKSRSDMMDWASCVYCIAPFTENEHGGFERVDEQSIARAYGRTSAEAIANARLIAAAPELLAALQQMRRWMPVYPAAAGGIVGGREAHAAAMAAANAAIAAATGEQA